MICTSCGAELAANGSFCPRCGAPAGDRTAAPSQTDAPGPRPEHAQERLDRVPPPPLQPEALGPRPDRVQERLDKTPPGSAPEKAPPEKKKGRGPLVAVAAVMAVLVAVGSLLFIFQQMTGHWPWEAGENPQSSDGEEKAGKRKKTSDADAGTAPAQTQSETGTGPAETPVPANTVYLMAGDPLPEGLDYDSVDRDAGESIGEKLYAQLPVLGNPAVKRGDVTAVTFTGDPGKAPAAGAWDVSAAKDGSVKAWTENGRLYIAAAGRIRPESCKDLFCGYIRLRSVAFGTVFDTSGVTDMSGMFEDCWALKTLDVSGFDTSSVTNMNWMFEMCVQLETLDLSSWDTSRVEQMTWMFNCCKGLKQLDVSGFDTRSVTDMNTMFSCCRSLTALDLTGFDTSNVTDMGWMFDECESLVSLDLSGFDTSAVTNMYSMFGDCVSLTSLDVSGFDTSRVTDMGYMFYNCVSMSEFHIESFSADASTNVDCMFGLDADMSRKYEDVRVYNGSGVFRPGIFSSSDGWFADGAEHAVDSA